MLDYLKRIIIVKEKSSSRKVKGSVKIIRERGKVKLVANLIALDSNFNGYAWQLCGDNKTVLKNMENGLTIDMPLDDDFQFFKGASFSIFNKENNEIICYGEYGEPCLKENQIENKIDYDDELIATENYYQRENEELLLKQIDGVENKNNEKIEEKEICLPPIFNETDFSRFQNGNYGEMVREKLNKLLNSHEKMTPLNDSVEGGSFVKINYDNYRSYIVGKIEKEGEIKYILYGVQGSFGVFPENFHPSAKFIPESDFNLEGLGYYFIFQDGVTGEII